MKEGDLVEIKDAVGKTWRWLGRKVRIIGEDKHCYTGRTSDGQQVRDVKEHFRPLVV